MARGSDCIYGCYYRFYLDNGFTPIPARGKQPLVKWKEFSPRGAEAVAERFRDANIALRVENGLFVIDFDSKEAADRFVELVMERGRESLKKALRSTWWVATSRGLHLYLVSAADVQSAKYKDIDVKGVNSLVIAPPSIHPSGGRYRFLCHEGVCYGPRELCECDASEFVERPKALTEVETEELLQLVAAAGGATLQASAGGGAQREGRAPARPPPQRLRELSADEVRAVYDAVKDAYRPGYRQVLMLYLAGWGAKAGVHPASIARVLKLLHESSGDDDPIPQRASSIAYSYAKAGVWSEELRKSVEEVLGSRIYSPAGQQPEEVKGRTGLEELLTQALGEEVALERLWVLQNVFGRAAGNVVIYALDFSKGKYLVVREDKCRTYLAERVKEGGIRLTKVIMEAAVLDVSALSDAITNTVTYNVKICFSHMNGHTIELAGVTGEEIHAVLHSYNAIISRPPTLDPVASSIAAIMRYKQASIKTGITAPGIYLVEGRLDVVNIDLPEEYSVGDLKALVSELGELARFYREPRLLGFAIAYGMVSQFAYAVKQAGGWIPWVYLFGVAGTGKSSLAELMAGVGGGEVLTGSAVDTVARLGEVLSRSTAPAVVNEVGGLLAHESTLDMVKNAIDRKIARAKITRRGYIVKPSLRVLIITSNKTLPRDDALRRRFIRIFFPPSYRPRPERQREFEQLYSKILPKVRLLGLYALKLAVEKQPIDKLKDWVELAHWLLGELDRLAGGSLPDWLLDWEVMLDETMDAEMEELALVTQVKSIILGEIVSAYNKYIGRKIVQLAGDSPASLAEVIDDVAQTGVIDWLYPSRLAGYYVITRPVVDLLSEHNIALTLSALCKMLSGDYKVVKVDGFPLRGCVVRASSLTIKLDDISA